MRFSIATKPSVPIGNLSRSGRSPRSHEALDRDMEPVAKSVPFGLKKCFVKFVASKTEAAFKKLAELGS